MRENASQIADPLLPAVNSGAGSRLAVCLAGFGFRAIPFQLGALRRLNEFGLLSQIDTISAVSGGSLVAAWLARNWSGLLANRQGAFVNFEGVIARPLERLIGRDVVLEPSFWSRLNPWSWIFRPRATTTTEHLANHFDRKMFKGSLLRDLPSQPRFVLSACNLRTGGRWEFASSEMGEELLGQRPPERLRVSQAIAASLAYPIHFPPLELSLSRSGYQGGTLGPRGDGLRRRVTLVDGGIVDRLAIESVWKSHPTIVCIDAGQVFTLVPDYDDWFGNRLFRAFCIHQQQAVELHKRWLIESLIAGALSGAYIGLEGYHGNYGLSGSLGYPRDVVAKMRFISTELRPFSRKEIMILTNHGYTLADAAVRRHLPGRLTTDALAHLPYPELTDRNRVLSVVEPEAERRAA